MWQVTWNPTRFDCNRMIQDYNEGRHTGYIKQSKGMARMTRLPTIGDEVYVSCAKKKILKCQVMSDFVTNEQEMLDEYHIGSTYIQPHTQNNTFLMMKIIEVYPIPEEMKGFQRTWVNLH